MTLDTKAARDLCDAALPGPWEMELPINTRGWGVCLQWGTHLFARQTGYKWKRRETFRFLAHARTLLPLALDEIDRLRAELADEERSHGETIDERDHFANRIDEIADALGDDTEWSNANDRGANALELARAASKDLARLRADLNNIYSTAAEPVIRIMAEDALK